MNAKEKNKEGKILRALRIAFANFAVKTNTIYCHNRQSQIMDELFIKI